MKYWVNFKVDARFTAPVEADSIEESLKKGYGEYIDADFGAASDIDGEPISIEDENGNIVWEKQ